MAFGTTTKIEKYNPDKIELIKRNLEQHQQVGQARLYEIQVDGLRAVPKTGDISQFENHEMYVSDDTQQIKIMLYQGNSHKYDAFIFTLKEEVKPPSPIASLGEMPDIVEDKVRQAMRERDVFEYKKRIVELEEELEESKDYIEELEKQVEILQATTTKENRFYDMAFAILAKGNDFVKRNPHVLAKIPVVGETLAGDLMKQNLAEEQYLQQQMYLQQNPSAEPNASFSEKEV